MDKELEKLNKREERRQREMINLIASENYMSPAVREALGSVTANKYAEGYPGARYYPGCEEAIDPIERITQERALKLMGLDSADWGVNVQALSGVPANLASLFAVLETGDSVLGMKLSAGGHLSHGHPVSVTGKLFSFHQYGLDRNGYIDYEEVERLAQEHRPKLIICGASAYSRTVDFKRFGAITKKHNTLLLADVAHIAGLIAGGMHPSPFPYADIVTTTTHKTLRGPRGALIFGKSKLMTAINKSVFPGMQGGPHNNQTLAIGVALGEASTPSFKSYVKRIVENANVLAEELLAHGFHIVSGGTDNHLFLLDLRSHTLSGKEAEELLYKAGIVANRNTVPEDPRGPFDPSGIRMGTPAITTLGFREKDMRTLAQWIVDVLDYPSGENIPRVKKEIQTHMKQYASKNT